MKKKTEFKIKVVDRGKMKNYLFSFRNIEDLAKHLQREQDVLEKRQIDWNNKMERLWGEINRLKADLEV